jgi:hypothetical protein
MQPDSHRKAMKPVGPLLVDRADQHTHICRPPPTPHSSVEIDDELLLYDFVTPWAPATSFCEHVGGSLAAVNSQTDMEAVTSLVRRWALGRITGPVSLWLGASTAGGERSGPGLQRHGIAPGKHLSAFASHARASNAAP